LFAIFPHRVNKFLRILRIRLKTSKVVSLADLDGSKLTTEIRRWRHPIASNAVAILVIRNLRYPRKAFPDEARERGIVVRGASTIVDVAKAPEFCEGQRRVDRPELVGAFRDKAIQKELPVPRLRRADVLDMEPDVRGAIAQQLVIPLWSLVELVGTFDVIEEKGSGSFRGRRNQVIEIG
jgi:hypothetical protein